MSRFKGHYKDKSMSNQHSPSPRHDEPAVYEIRLRGRLGPQWTEWFGGMAITLEENGDTVLTGPVADQAALHGLLRTVRDLAMPLIAVNRLEPGG